MMRLIEFDEFFVFPSYGVEFANMMPRLKTWYSEFGRDVNFWHGFSGGGVLGIPTDHPISGHPRYSTVAPGFSLMTIYGCVLGNESGTSLAESVFRVTPDSPPALAVTLGLAQRVPEPTVKITAEHACTAGDIRYLLVVPRKNRRSLKLIDQVPTWFDTFGVDVLETKIPERLTDEISCWFDDPRRPMYAFEMRGGEDNAAWQLAITVYVAEHWDVHARGLDTLHFVASIDGKPNFRQNWTSNK